MGILASIDYNQIDYILIKKRWLRCVTNARSYPGLDCGSDHNLVGLTAKLRISKVIKEQGAVKLNMEGLKTETNKQAYNALISNKFEALNMLGVEREPEELFTII